MKRVLEEQHEKYKNELTGCEWQKVLLEQDPNVLAYKKLLEKVKKAEKLDYEILLQGMRDCEHVLLVSKLSTPDGETTNICYCMKCPFDTGFIESLRNGKELTHLQRAQQQVYCQVFRNGTVISNDDYDSELVREVYKNTINSHPELPDTLATKYVMAYLKNMSIKKRNDESKSRRQKRLEFKLDVKKDSSPNI